MPVFPSTEAPFGPLQTLHEHILRTAQPLTFSNAHHLLLYPLVPLFLQGWLLQYDGTRKWRIPVGLMTLYLTTAAWMGYRFTQPWLNAGNNLIGVAMLHLIGKAVEFALLENSVPDPYSGRNTIMRTYDLLFNSRWIGLRDIDVGSDLRRPSTRTNPTADSSKDGQTRHRSIERSSDDRWLSKPVTNRTRRQATLRHIKLSIIYGISFDTLLHLLRYFGRDTVGVSHVSTDGFERFMSQTFVFLPHTEYQIGIPRLIVDLVVKVAIGAGVFNMLILAYHLAAAVMVGTAIYETAAWEVDFFFGPLGTDSLLEFWGRGWHQVFRHHFHLLTSLLMQILHLPRSALLPSVFSLSGGLHALGQLSMSPSPNPSALFLFFLVNGFGCMAEISWKRWTGKKVHGWPGWIWRTAFLTVSSSWAVRAELQSGLGGTRFLPWENGPGRWLSRVIARYLVDIV